MHRLHYLPAHLVKRRKTQRDRQLSLGLSTLSTPYICNELLSKCLSFVEESRRFSFFSSFLPFRRRSSANCNCCLCSTTKFDGVWQCLAVFGRVISTTESLARIAIPPKKKGTLKLLSTQNKRLPAFVSCSSTVFTPFNPFPTSTGSRVPLLTLHFFAFCLW